MVAGAWGGVMVLLVIDVDDVPGRLITCHFTGSGKSQRSVCFFIKVSTINSSTDSWEFQDIVFKGTHTQIYISIQSSGPPQDQGLCMGDEHPLDRTMNVDPYKSHSHGTHIDIGQCPLLESRPPHPPCHVSS